MAYHPEGVKLVLTAPDTESTEQAFSPWKQIMYASAPAQCVPRFFCKNKFEQPRNEDGSARVMTYGVRVAEEVPRRAYPDDDVVVCYPDDLHTFVGRRTVAISVGAHNPIGTAFSTGVYSKFLRILSKAYQRWRVRAGVSSSRDPKAKAQSGRWRGRGTSGQYFISEAPSPARPRNLTAHVLNKAESTLIAGPISIVAASGSGCPPKAFLSEIIRCLKAHPVFGVRPAEPLEIDGELWSKAGLAIEEDGQLGLRNPELASGLSLAPPFHPKVTDNRSRVRGIEHQLWPTYGRWQGCHEETADREPGCTHPHSLGWGDQSEHDSGWCFCCEFVSLHRCCRRNPRLRFPDKPPLVPPPGKDPVRLGL